MSDSQNATEPTPAGGPDPTTWPSAGRIVVGREREVTIICEAVEGHPAQALVLAAADAAALVVGTRGHGGFVGALLGSVSQHVVAHARCPVIVIPRSVAQTRRRAVTTPGRRHSAGAVRRRPG